MELKTLFLNILISFVHKILSMMKYLHLKCLNAPFTLAILIKKNPDGPVVILHLKPKGVPKILNTILLNGLFKKLNYKSMTLTLIDPYLSNRINEKYLKMSIQKKGKK
jgi:hypothetical protein